MAKKARRSAPPTSIFARTTTLIGMATKVAVKEVSTRIAERAADSKLLARIDQAQEVVAALSKLRGAAMKAGQILSIEGRDFFPPEVLKVLSRLQDSSTAMDTKTVHRILKRELGLEKFKELKNLTDEPVASASIGQVHRAEIDGETVAIKVQFPGVARSIDSDIAVLKKLSQTLMKIAGKQVEFDELMKELKQVLKQEVDYEKEAESAKIYRERLGKLEGYTVPKVYERFSTKHVLTLEWMPGIRFQDWIDSHPPRALREKAGAAMLDLFFTEFFEWGFVQTDPNLGNFLILENPFRLAVLDFGATLVYDEAFRRDYKNVLREIYSGDGERMVQAAIDFGVLDTRESQETRNLYRKMMQVSFEPFSPELQPFRFGDLDYSARVRDALMTFVRSAQYSAPPRKIIFLHRKLGGIFNILKALDVQIDLVPYWQRVLKL